MLLGDHPKDPPNLLLLPTKVPEDGDSTSGLFRAGDPFPSLLLHKLTSLNKTHKQAPSLCKEGQSQKPD